MVTEAEKRAAGLGRGLDLGAHPVSPVELERRRREQRANDDRIRAAHRREDEAREGRLQERRAAHEAELRRRGEASALAHRANVERELRRNGAAEAAVKRLADEEMRRYHLDRVTGVTNLAEQTRREMKAAWRGASPIIG
jgi:hypothetical protein